MSVDGNSQAISSLQERWDQQRESMRSQRIPYNTLAMASDLRIGGLDISFVPGDEIRACAGYVICQAPDYRVIHSQTVMVELTAPYVPGYLAFREADPLVALVRQQIDQHPDRTPHVLMVDGNGVLHTARFGLACHVGVMLDLPCVGVAKNLFQMSDEGVLRNAEHHAQVRNLTRPGDDFPICDRDGKVLGLALKTSAESTNPVYVSVGHRIDLSTAKAVAMSASVYRVPEPTRRADMISREFIRQHWTT